MDGELEEGDEREDGGLRGEETGSLSLFNTTT